jgi:hypothetical protein
LDQGVAMDLDNIVGIRLIGGPAMIDGYKGAYRLDQLGGWPLPEFLAALVVMNRVAVALPVKVPINYQKDVTIYQKIAESKLPDDLTGNLMRGATYEAVN